jgi:probable HAF family extracellular repeat protein
MLGITIPTRSANSFSFAPLDVPAATQTHAFGINGAGQIVGTFEDAGGKEHGFLRTASGTFTTIDRPGATSTGAWGINDAGQIMGFFEDVSGNNHGFVTTR